MRRAVPLLVLSITVLTLTSATLAQRGTPQGQWPTYGGEPSSTRYSPLAQITRENLDRLEEIGRAHV